MHDIQYYLLSNSQQKLCLIQMYKLFAEIIFKKIEIKPIFLIDEIEATFDNNSLQDVFLGLSHYFKQIFVTGIGSSKSIITNIDDDILYFKI